MSCAPRLISLSSSGNRYESVSRESSVHSMMSMNCFLRKSMMAIEVPPSGKVGREPGSLRDGRPSLLGGCQSRGFGLALLDLDFETIVRERPGQHRAVGEDHRRCGDDLELFAERGRRRDRIVAIAVDAGGKRTGGEEVVPRF